jgi:hypothetical protein
MISFGIKGPPRPKLRIQICALGPAVHNFSASNFPTSLRMCRSHLTIRFQIPKLCGTALEKPLRYHLYDVGNLCTKLICPQTHVASGKCDGQVGQGWRGVNAPNHDHVSCPRAEGPVSSDSLLTRRKIGCSHQGIRNQVSVERDGLPDIGQSRSHITRRKGEFPSSTTLSNSRAKVRCPIWTAFSGPPLTASFPGHSCGFSELVRTLRKDASSVLLYIIPKDQIFDAPLSLRGPRSSSRHSAQRSAGLRSLSIKVGPEFALSPWVPRDWVKVAAQGDNRSSPGHSAEGCC